MAFLRVVEVFPPLYPSSKSNRTHLALKVGLERFVEGVRSIRDLGDVFLVADVKNPNLLKLSTIEASLILKQRLNVDSAPVIVVRDVNRPRFLSSILTAISLELRSMMIAWGDDYPASAHSTNVRDFPSLGAAIRQASLLASRARAPTRFFAPVDIDRLANREGVAMAKQRIKAGAEYLLAQPPTTDAEETFERHITLVRDAGLQARVLLNVFPFRGVKDVEYCEKYFGWRLPRAVHRAAAGGEGSLVKMEREVVKRLRDEGFPGVYLTTRGSPAIAEMLLS